MWVFLLHLEKSNYASVDLLKKSSILGQIILQTFCTLLRKGVVCCRFASLWLVGR